jgi:hypothetical protein
MLVSLKTKREKKGHQITMSRRRGETKQWADAAARLLKKMSRFMDKTTLVHGSCWPPIARRPLT